MYTRIVSCNVRPGKKDNFDDVLNGEILDLLREQDGFRDLIGLWSEREPNRAIAISLWDSKEDAETYYKKDYTRVVEVLTPLITGQPTVETYNVDVSTLHNIAHGRAA